MLQPKIFSPEIIQGQLIDFLSACPTPYQVQENAYDDLVQRFKYDGKFSVLREGEAWKLERGWTYYVEHGSSFAVFHIPENASSSLLRYSIAAVHSDSPAYKLKAKPVVEDGGYARLNVAEYGSPLRRTWLDRPLSVAGRVVTMDGSGKLSETPVDLRGALTCTIPSLAIHMGGGKDDYPASVQKDMLPLIGKAPENGDASDMLWEPVRELLAYDGRGADEILGFDLFAYCDEEPREWGAGGHWVSGPRIDDLACTYAALHAFPSHDVEPGNIPVLFVFDNEEVGSQTRQGARSAFAPEVLSRISASLPEPLDGIGHSMVLSRSFLVSADNAHAAHPAHLEKADVSCRPELDSGIVLKHSANQRYCTDGASAARFKAACREAGVQFQEFENNSDVAGGSTLGNLMLGSVSVPAVDIGIPQWAMHSAFECCSAGDVAEMSTFFRHYFEHGVPKL